jgi:hypothetical protein
MIVALVARASWASSSRERPTSAVVVSTTTPLGSTTCAKPCPWSASWFVCGSCSPVLVSWTRAVTSSARLRRLCSMVLSSATPRRR